MEFLEWLTMAGLDINTPMMVLALVWLYYQRRDISELDADLKDHVKSCGRDRDRLWIAFTGVRESVAKLTEAVSFLKREKE